MPALVMVQNGEWFRQELPVGTRWILTRQARSLRATCMDESERLPLNSLGVVVVSGNRDTFFLPVSDWVPAYINAEAIPALLVRRLWSEDKVTFHPKGEPALRFWYDHRLSRTQYPQAGSDNERCDYCGSKIQPGEEVEGCACGEILHKDCLAHARRKCPRCKQEIPVVNETWYPLDFLNGDDECDD
jgi:hypothetical protein